MADKLANAIDADEEDMFDDEGRDFTAVKEEEKDDGFVVEKDKELQETLVVFENNQFIMYDFMTNKSW